MPEIPTPGQVAYEAHAHFWDRDMLCTPAWNTLPAMHQEAWEVAAQAVLVWQEQEKETT